MCSRMRFASLAGVCLILVMGGCESTTGPQKTVRDPKAPSASAPLAENVPDAPQPEILPDTHMAAGRLHETQGHLARAVEQYRQAIALNPRHLEAWNRLGIVLDQLGRFKEADEAFKKAIAVAPKAAYLHNNLGFSYMTQSRWPEAEVELKHALELSSEFIRARINLAMACAQQDRFDDAMEQFRRALPLEDAYYNMGLMYQSKRRLVEAARSFKSALEKNPKLVAAQKRLDMLPPDILSAASLPVVTVAASPVPASMPSIGSTDATQRPSSTRPADEPTARQFFGPRLPVDLSTFDLEHPLPALDVISPAEACEPADFLLHQIDPLEPVVFEAGPADDGPVLYTVDGPLDPALVQARLTELWDSMLLPLTRLFGPPAEGLDETSSMASPLPVSVTPSDTPAERPDRTSSSTPPAR